MVQRVLLAVAGLAAGVWLAAGLHSARLADEAQSIASTAPERLAPSDVDRSVRLFERARRRNPDTRVMLNQAGLLSRAGRAREAVALAREVTSREPENADAWALLAIAASPVDPGLAARASARARRLNPRVAAGG